MNLDDQKKRFSARYTIDPGGCWVWNGKPNPDGYSNVTSLAGFTKVRTNAHRMSYLLHHGEIPLGREVDHLCQNKMCVNPQHLEAVTHKENVHRIPGGRGGGKGRTVGWRATSCKRGHDLTNPVILDRYINQANGKAYYRCRLCKYLRPSWQGPVPGWAVEYLHPEKCPC